MTQLRRIYFTVAPEANQEQLMTGKKVTVLRPAEMKNPFALRKGSLLIKDHFSHSSKPNYLSLKIAEMPYEKTYKC